MNGPYLGVDLGAKHTGFALSDPEGKFATPLSTIHTASMDRVQKEILKTVEQYTVKSIVLGLPKFVRHNPIETKIKEMASELTERIPEIEIHYWDELYTSQIAASNIDSGADRKKLGHAEAARIILQGFLDFKRTGV